MNLSRLRRLDFQLLIVFKTVMEHRQLTRAADELGVTQSALSHALKRLRGVIGEDLFVRRQFGMEPTEAALRLIGPIEHILCAAEHALEAPAPFDPATSDQTLRIAFAPELTPTLLPKLTSLMEVNAPGMNLAGRWLEHGDPITLLDDDAADLVVAPLCAVPERISAIMLTHTRYCVAARKGHPTIAKKFGISKYLKASHARLCEPGSIDEPVERAISSSGLARRIGLEAPDILSTLCAIRDSNLIATIPETIAKDVGKSLGLRIRPVPLDIPPIICALFTHERNAENEAVKWIAKRIRTIARAPDSN